MTRIFLEIFVSRENSGEVRFVQARSEDAEQAAWLAIRQLLEQRAMDQAENGGVRPNAQREGQQQNGRESGRPRKQPQGVLEVLHSCI